MLRILAIGADIATAITPDPPAEAQPNNGYRKDESGRTNQSDVHPRHYSILQYQPCPTSATLLMPLV